MRITSSAFRDSEGWWWRTGAGGLGGGDGEERERDNGLNEHRRWSVVDVGVM